MLRTKLQNTYLLKSIHSLLLFVSLLLFANVSGFAQEFNARVVVDFSQINQGPTDKQLFTNLQTQIGEFLNNRKWTSDQFSPIERINVNISLIIDQRSNNKFAGKMQIQASRPVYNSSYNTVLFNFNDQDISFDYIEFQQMEFNDATFTDNITQIFAYYAYVILGFDYCSFEQDAGFTYFNKALNVLNNAQSSGGPGWRSNEKLTNRYWYITNILNKTYAAVFSGLYKYHRLGLDKMYEDTNAGKTIILEALDMMNKSFQNKPGSIFQQTLMNTKSEELINIFKPASNAEKQKFLTLINSLDPTNGLKYQRINQ